jgi:galactokinase
MDQFVACFGKAGHAIFLDCRSMEYAAVPFPSDVRMVVCNTMVKHEIASGAYNERRAECDEAVAQLKNALPGIRALRDVTLAELEQHSHLLTDVIFRRARHVVSENERVLAARKALEGGKLSEVGALMRKSHASLRDDYEVSCKELDVMAELANGFDGCFGARMTGGGFGGCTINLVRVAQVEKFSAQMLDGYERATGIAPEIYSCAAVDGAREIV